MDSRRSSSSFFDREKHVVFLQMMNQLLPSDYQGQEINRLTLAYFAISGLHILGALDENHQMNIWVAAGQFFGFHGSRSSQFPRDDKGVLIHNGSHLASTYCALAILKIVGYNFSCINSKSILTSMRNLQQPDGSFMPTHVGAETDLRFVFCAAAICSMLENWSGMDKEKAKEYILNCQSYDGGFGLIPGSESHGVYWVLPSSVRERQAADGGFQGRANKASDTCYAFWVLRILGGYKLIDKKALHGFLLTCQSQYGGFSKFPGQLPDLYHSYYGFSAFSMLEEPGLIPICVELGIADIAAIGH
ncbi:Geranylgeranyl transferase type-1 subunit beta [Vitis vinifera]|uniref:Geranylgeranyl transferase type-1 subunit beta n=1 Tax=Vitis vinifera TaxID=29760 RepID=A0A438JY56_VITVI|nr:Geranylgeranyl transferase type-1 subunit beta [Vitis vinifera]